MPYQSTNGNAHYLTQTYRKVIGGVPNITSIFTSTLFPQVGVPITASFVTNHPYTSFTCQWFYQTGGFPNFFLPFGTADNLTASPPLASSGKLITIQIQASNSFGSGAINSNTVPNTVAP